MMEDERLVFLLRLFQPFLFSKFHRAPQVGDDSCLRCFPLHHPLVVFTLFHLLPRTV